MPYVLLATDADWIRSEVASAISDERTTIGVVSDGKAVVVAARDRLPDLVITDLQVGNMGGMAITMALRHEESGRRLDHVPVLVLLDRPADVHLARRSGADGWLVKPLDTLRLRGAVAKLLSGGTWHESGDATNPVAETTVTDEAAAS
jgi:DNA-binding response OmpR family regulator